MSIKNIPTWYLPNTAGASSLASFQNAILPYLRSSAQIAAAENLATGDPTFSSYNSSFDLRPETRSDIRSFLTRERAERALSALNRMSTISGTSLDSPGVKYLRDAAKLLRDSSSLGRPMSRAALKLFSESMSAMRSSQAARDAEGFATLANFLTDIEPPAPVVGSTSPRNLNKKLYG